MKPSSLRKYSSLLALGAGLLAPIAQAQTVDELVPGSIEWGSSDWYSSNWFGLFWAGQDYLPWVWNWESGWWFTTDIGWYWSASHSSDTASDVIDDESIAAMRSIVDAAISNYEIPGIIYGLKFLGQDPWVDARGIGDTASQTPMSPDAHFRIGSASKTFVGLAALQLIQSKELSFETRIAHYLDEDVLSNYDKSTITIRMLLQHTSGINNYTNIIEDWFFPYILDRTREWTDEELVELINSRYDLSPPEGGKVFDPGAGWYYSNTNTVLLAMIIERITGIGIGEYIEQAFLAPLGLEDTYYPAVGDSTLPEPYARGYIQWANFTGEPSLPDDLLDVSVYDPSGVGAAGPMISTAADLLVWMEAIVQDPRLAGKLQASHIDWNYYISFSSTSPGERSGSYGMNIAHEPDLQNEANYYIIGHRGQISGYDTAVMYLPEKNCAIIVVCNRSLKFDTGFPTNSLETAMNEIIATLFPDLIENNRMAGVLEAKSAVIKRVAPLKEY